MARPGLDDLPNELVQMVCKTLRQADLVNLVRVCKRVQPEAQKALQSRIEVDFRLISTLDRSMLFNALDSQASFRANVKEITMHHWDVEKFVGNRNYLVSPDYAHLFRLIDIIGRLPSLSRFRFGRIDSTS